MRHLAWALAILLPLTAQAIPPNPGGVDFSVVGCTGIYKIDPDTFVVDCDANNVTVTTLTVTNNLIIPSSFTISGFTLYGSTDNAGIQSVSCPTGTGTCGYYSTDEGDLYISTGTGAGQWRNSRTGKGP